MEGTATSRRSVTSATLSPRSARSSHRCAVRVGVQMESAVHAAFLRSQAFWGYLEKILSYFLVECELKAASSGSGLVCCGAGGTVWFLSTLWVLVVCRQRQWVSGDEVSVRQSPQICRLHSLRLARSLIRASLSTPGCCPHLRRKLTHQLCACI